jgi:hypothetical protein
VAIDYLGWYSPIWNEYLAQGNAAAIPPILDFYQKLVDRGWNVGFVTGRKVICVRDFGDMLQEYLYNATRANLIQIGCTNFTLILRTKEEEKLTNYQFKSGARNKLTDGKSPLVLLTISEGWRIMGMCGDQDSDLEGAHAGYKMKVPNYAFISL